MFGHISDPNIVVVVYGKTMWHVKGIRTPAMEDGTRVWVQY